ncbi:MAG: ABC transporter substrate-binding protein [Betaproteobacteria bacterium]|nr:ABC transporter substrate-binding protein [Betaproteobacteria bacterium]
MTMNRIQKLAAICIFFLSVHGVATIAASPINVGAISSLTGPVPFPEATAAAKAVFDRVNAQGGINGRLINYLVADDKADPALTAQAARRLVDQDGVVAMLGSASLLECSVNASFYAKKGIYAVQGVGVDPVCFNSPNISPVNTGPYLGVTADLYFASEVLKDKRICVILYNAPSGAQESHKQAIARWSAITGKKPVLVDLSLQISDDPTPNIIKAKEKGCDAIVHNGVEPHAIVWAKALKVQGLKVHQISLTSMYTEKVASELARADAEGLYANSEFEPYTLASPEIKDWRSLMNQAQVPSTSFAQAGYVAATIFVDVLKGIKGEINRESVAQALRTLKPIRSPLMGTPYTFGVAPAHNSNHASKFVQARHSKWELVTPEWIVLPAK